MSLTPLAKIRRAICERSGGQCECGCKRFVDTDLGRADHFWGRKLAVESVETVWFLSIECDSQKTVNAPSQAHWLLRFMLHCFNYGFVEQAHRAAIRLSVLEQKFGAHP